MECVYCAVRTEYLNIFLVNFRLYMPDIVTDLLFAQMAEKSCEEMNHY